MTPTERRLAECQQIIGYYFSNPMLLATALTHSSLRAPDRECNERLEFLGDSVLGLVITEELYHLLPDQSEGELTRIKSAVVSRSALLSTSQMLGLQRFAEFARGVGRRDKLPASVVANLVEAVIGAIYLDAGYYPAREFVLRHMGPAIDDELHDRGAKNYKSLLQHEVQQSVGVTPTYRTLDADGPDHAKEFVVAAIIRGQEWGQASGPTKKDAEQEAARLALEAWGRRGRGRRRRRKRKAVPSADVSAQAGVIEEALVEEALVEDRLEESVEVTDLEGAGPVAQEEIDAPAAADAPSAGAVDVECAAEPETGDKPGPERVEVPEPGVADDIERTLARRKQRSRRKRRADITVEDLEKADAAAIAAESAADEPAPEPAPEPGAEPAGEPGAEPVEGKLPRRERRRSRRAPRAESDRRSDPEPAAGAAAEPPAPESDPRPDPDAVETPKRKRAATRSAFGAGIDVPSGPAAAPKPPEPAKTRKVAAPARKRAPEATTRRDEGGFAAGI